MWVLMKKKLNNNLMGTHHTPKCVDGYGFRIRHEKSGSFRTCTRARPHFSDRSVPVK